MCKSTFVWRQIQLKHKEDNIGSVKHQYITRLSLKIANIIFIQMVQFNRIQYCFLFCFRSDKYNSVKQPYYNICQWLTLY